MYVLFDVAFVTNPPVYNDITDLSIKLGMSAERRVAGTRNRSPFINDAG